MPVQLKYSHPVFTGSNTTNVRLRGRPLVLDNDHESLERTDIEDVPTEKRIE